MRFGKILTRHLLVGVPLAAFTHSAVRFAYDPAGEPASGVDPLPFCIAPKARGETKELSVLLNEISSRGPEGDCYTRTMPPRHESQSRSKYLLRFLPLE